MSGRIIFDRQRIVKIPVDGNLRILLRKMITKPEIRTSQIRREKSESLQKTSLLPVVGTKPTRGTISWKTRHEDEIRVVQPQGIGVSNVITKSEIRTKQAR